MNDATRRSLAIFGLTGVAAFGVNAAGHAWMLWRGNPLVRRNVDRSCGPEVAIGYARQPAYVSFGP